MPAEALTQGSIAATKKALAKSNVRPEDIGALIYAGVCREGLEPATACRIAAGVGVPDTCAVYDISNACLGALNGAVEIANRIELGQIKAGIVVSCETAREIVEETILRLRQHPTMEGFKGSLATLTGGSGAAAMLITDGSFTPERKRRLVGGVTQAAPQHYALCRWAFEPAFGPVGQLSNPVTFIQSMKTDSVAVLKHGVQLGLKTWGRFRDELRWAAGHPQKFICHQVGTGHREAILGALGIATEQDFSTFEYLGNIGTVSLPLTAALAEEREFLRPGDQVSFLGIGSGLNCLMLGWEW
jgi:3-oxoacyl-[acyl-carrier-protein] synthase-3